MPSGRRLWRTEAGDLVEDGHPDGVVLAYGIDDELAESDLRKVKAAVHTPKKAAAAATKRPGK